MFKVKIKNDIFSYNSVVKAWSKIKAWLDFIVWGYS